MKVNFSLDEIFGRKPKDVGKLFRRQGINPARPYRVKITFNGVTVEQEKTEGFYKPQILHANSG